MRVRPVQFLHIGALVLLGGLAAYSTLQGIVAAIFLAGFSESFGLPVRVTAFLSDVPAWRFLIGYTLIALHIAAWLLLLRRSFWSLHVFIGSVVLRIFLTLLMAWRPESQILTGYILLVVEASIAVALVHLYLARYIQR